MTKQPQEPGDTPPPAVPQGTELHRDQPDAIGTDDQEAELDGHDIDVRVTHDQRTKLRYDQPDAIGTDDQEVELDGDTSTAASAHGQHGEFYRALPEREGGSTYVEPVSQLIQWARDPSPAVREKGWVGLYAHYSDRLYYLALSYLGGNGALAREVAHDTLSHAWVVFDSCRAQTRAELSSWLMKSCVNRARRLRTNLRRELERIYRKSYEEYYQELDEDGRALPAALVHQDRTDEQERESTQPTEEELAWLAFQRAFNTLSPKERVCTWLRLKKKTDTEIVKELCMDIRTVRCHLSRARKKLMKALRDHRDDTS